MGRLAPLVAVALIAAACGSSSSKPAGPGPGTVVFQGSAWAVVLDRGRATAQHLVNGRWVAAPSGGVTISILGPEPRSTGNATTPQVAAELRSSSPLVESALWVDGRELSEKGGGTPTRGTIYGAPASPLAAGKHTAVAYGRTNTHATAVAWTFSV